MKKFQAVKGTAQKGARVTHTPKSLPSNAPAENSVPGGSAGGGTKGGENARGSAGNEQKSGTP